MSAKKPSGGPNEYKSIVRPASVLHQRTFGKESLERAKRRKGRKPNIRTIGRK